MRKLNYTFLGFIFLLSIIYSCESYDVDTVKIHLVTMDKIAPVNGGPIDKWVKEFANYYKIEGEKTILVPEVYIIRPDLVSDTPQRIIVKKDWTNEIKNLLGAYSWKDIVNDYDNFLEKLVADSDYFTKSGFTNDSLFAAYENEIISNISTKQYVFYYSDNNNCINDERQIYDLQTIRDSIQFLYEAKMITANSDIYIFYNWCVLQDSMSDLILDTTIGTNNYNNLNSNPKTLEPKSIVVYNQSLPLPNFEIDAVFDTLNGTFTFNGIPKLSTYNYVVLVSTSSNFESVAKQFSTQSHLFPNDSDGGYSFVNEISSLNKSKVYFKFKLLSNQNQQLAESIIYGPYSVICSLNGTRKCKITASK